MGDKLKNAKDVASLRRRLLAWYDRHQRDLPWRRNQDPYRVWVSEIMLQQTRVAAVVERYREFLERFPTVQALAKAQEAAVLAAWSGLGYYRRARNLHAAAREIVHRSGHFPKTATEWEELPGIGKYTAAAIASIAFGEACAVVDGNVERVLERLSGERMSAAQTWEQSQRLLSPKRPGDFNQAMMELGATICLPQQPKCLVCPIATCCQTRGELPAIKTVERQKKRALHCALDCRDGRVFLTRRSRQESLMPGMWELPQLETEPTGPPWMKVRHSITVTDYDVRVARMAAPKGTRGRWVPVARLTEIPLTGLTRKILQRSGVI
jgi:A/G-specific adenine glycosylase